MTIPRRLRVLARWALAAGVAFGTLALASTVALSYAIAHAPNGRAPIEQGDDPPPAELALHGRAESLRVQSSDAEASLAAWVVEPKKRPRGTVVVLHGVRLDKHSMLPVAEALSDAGFRAVLLDLRGHGRSTGSYLTYGTKEARDVSTLLDALEARGTELGPVGVHGFSYGGATALTLAAIDPRVRAVVAVSSFASLREVVRDYVHWQLPRLEPAVPNVWLDAAVDLGGLWAGFDAEGAVPAAAASRTSADVLLLHGEDDPQVSPDNARGIALASGGRATLVLLPGETHASALSDARRVVRNRSVEWFSTHLR